MGHQHQHSDTKNIAIAFFLNLGFTIIEIIGGLLTNSVAILSDALHDFGDSVSLGLAWYFQKISKKKSTKKFSYGYKRFTLLGALINSIVLLIGSIFIIIEAIPRLLSPEEVNTTGMIGLAFLGILINGLAVLKLKDGKSLNEKVISLHLLEDVLGWLAVLIGGIIMHYFNIPIIDPILSLLIASFILFNVYRNLKQVIDIIMQGSISNKEQDSIKDYLLSLKEIKDIHDLHLWSLDGEHHVLSTHLVLFDNNNSSFDTASLKKEIRNKLKELNIVHATLELEYESEICDYDKE